MEPDSSLLHSQQRGICPYSEPDQSTSLTTDTESTPETSCTSISNTFPTTDYFRYNARTGKREIRKDMHCVHPVSLFESHMTHEIHISVDMKCAIFSPTVFIPNISHSNKTSGDLCSSYGCHMRRNGRRFACKRLITAAWFLPEPECSIRF
jgi:hypothetical protein